MKIKNLKKVLIATICLCGIWLITMNTNESAKVMATTERELIQQQEIIRTADINDIINAGNDFISKGEDGAEEIAEGKIDGIEPTDFAEMFVDIGSVLVAIGVVTLLIVSAVMAIKWITATPDKQAKLKQQLIGLVVAAVVIFGAIGIWNLVQGIMDDVEDSLGGTTDSSSGVIETKKENNSDEMEIKQQVSKPGSSQDEEDTSDAMKIKQQVSKPNN